MTMHHPIPQRELSSFGDFFMKHFTGFYPFCNITFLDVLIVEFDAVTFS